MKEFARGYQEALRDVAEQWDMSGAVAARKYIRINLQPTKCAQCGQLFKRNRRGELLHVGYMQHAFDHHVVTE